MTLGELAIILAAIGLVLVVSELFLPMHGILAISGIASLFGAVTLSFLVNMWLGIGSLTLGGALTPLFGAWLVHFGTDKTQQWLLVRMQQPNAEGQQPDSSQ